MSEVRTRFAPSPTGFLHIGGLRTALYSYAFAKSPAFVPPSAGLRAGKQGKFILRIEDTDQNRQVPGATEKIFEILKTFGLNWDEGPYIQSERVKTGIYKKYAEKLVSEGHGYYCFCPPKSKEEIKETHEQKIIELRDSCRDLPESEAQKRIANGEKAAIRLRVPDNETVSFFDFVINKEISWETKNIDEVMLLKSDGFPTYHLGVVVDDAEMQISHIIRGRDWLPSTPVHLLLFKYLGFKLPQIGHLTDILDPEGGKLSKRKGSVSCEELLAEGYLPEAILNFIMLLGWAPKDNRELFSLAEFVDNFQKGELQIANPVFNRDKLDWFNGVYIRRLSVDKLSEKLKVQSEKFAKLDEGKQISITKLIQDRIEKISDLESLAGFFFKKPLVDVSLFGDLDYKKHLKGAAEVLEKCEPWDNQTIQTALTSLIEKEGWKTGDFYMSFRVAVAGSRFTPPITQSAEILGKEETLERLRH